MKEFSSVSYDSYKNGIKEMKSFVTDSEWIWSLSYDFMINEELKEDILNYILRLKKCNLDYNVINSTIIEIKNKSIYYVEKAKKCKDAVDKWYLYRYSYAYYGFLETIIEGSIITEDILNRIKNEYGKNYLAVLKEVDKINPSSLTKFNKSESNESINMSSDGIKLYLLMKRWQDIEHIYHFELIEKHNLAKIEFENYVKSNFPYLSGIKGRSLLAIYLLDNTPLFSIEQLYKFFDNDIVDELASIVGGKNLGLAKLGYNEIKIPETYVIPVNSIKEQKYIDFISELPEYNYSIRSSATVEDNKNQSFAGLFLTKLNQEKKNILNAISEVSRSVDNERVRAYVKRFNTNNPYMSVVVQKFVEPSFSGVWLGSTNDKGHLEWVEGNGEKLVSGKIIPNYEDWNNSVEKPIKVNNEEIGKKCIEYQNKLGKIADFEWCVVNEELLFVQFRPVTKKFVNNYSQEKVMKDSFKGIAASSGIVKGRPVYIEDAEDIKTSDFKNGDILLADCTDPDWVPVMIESSAIITAEGGFLSHSAIISRELGIPCITGLGYNAISEISEYDYIEVNGSEGLVRKLTKNN